MVTTNWSSSDDMVFFLVKFVICDDSEVTLNNNDVNTIIEYKESNEELK